MNKYLKMKSKNNVDISQVEVSCTRVQKKII